MEISGHHCESVISGGAFNPAQGVKGEEVKEEAYKIPRIEGLQEVADIQKWTDLFSQCFLIRQKMVADSMRLGEADLEDVRSLESVLNSVLQGAFASTPDGYGETIGTQTPKDLQRILCKDRHVRIYLRDDASAMNIDVTIEVWQLYRDVVAFQQGFLRARALTKEFLETRGIDLEVSVACAKKQIEEVAEKKGILRNGKRFSLFFADKDGTLTTHTVFYATAQMSAFDGVLLSEAARDVIEHPVVVSSGPAGGKGSPGVFHLVPIADFWVLAATAGQEILDQTKPGHIKPTNVPEAEWVCDEGSVFRLEVEPRTQEFTEACHSQLEKVRFDWAQAYRKPIATEMGGRLQVKNRAKISTSYQTDPRSLSDAEAQDYRQVQLQALLEVGKEKNDSFVPVSSEDSEVLFENKTHTIRDVGQRDLELVPKDTGQEFNKAKAIETYLMFAGVDKLEGLVAVAGDSLGSDGIMVKKLSEQYGSDRVIAFVVKNPEKADEVNTQLVEAFPGENKVVVDSPLVFSFILKALSFAP